jgi:hypothetical protein
MRWIISQIHTLWDICKKDPKLYANSNSDVAQTELVSNKATAAGRLWRPWEHIYAVNKVVKGPFIPVYNPHGKYAVRLYFMVIKMFNFCFSKIKNLIFLNIKY